jgi:hypothetical protein
MPWSAGTYTRAYGATGWVNDRDASTAILATRHDTHDQDLAVGINACLAKDGSNAATANLNAGTYKITNLGTPTVSTDAATKAYVDSSASIVYASGDQLVWRSTVNPYTLPTGWTRVAQNDKALRISSGTGALSSGGTNAFSTAFNSSRATNSEASHTHTGTTDTATSTGPGVNPFAIGVTFHNHTFTTNAGSAHSHTLNLDVQYYEMNIIQKT